VVGFYLLAGGPPEAELAQMFVEPSHIGAGVGRTLWANAVETAAALGVERITIDADPHAEAFYLAMGAVRVGEVPSGRSPAGCCRGLVFGMSGLAGCWVACPCDRLASARDRLPVRPRRSPDRHR
jgi:hypothetical protein